MDHVAHQRAISKRFAELIAQGEAVFLDSASGIKLPFTLSGDGQRRELNGINRLMLLQVMKERGWQDPRFFTARQAQDAGWDVRPEAAPVTLQFFSSLDGQGLPLKQPEVKRFKVYNAHEIGGVSPLSPSRDLPSAQHIRVAAARAGYEPGQSQLRSTMVAWTAAFQNETKVSGATPLLALQQRIAVMLVEAQTWFPLETLEQDIDLAAWAQALNTNPLALPGCVKGAELIATQIMAQIRAVEAEMQMREADKRIQESPRVPAGEQARRKAEYMARVEAMFQSREAVLAVPYSEKDTVQKLGAIWYPPLRVWFVPQGLDVGAFKAWDPRSTTLGVTALESEIIDKFSREMAEHGLDASNVIADGNWHNVRVESKRSKANKSGSYVLNLAREGTGEPSGLIVNHHLGITVPWRWEGPALTPEQKARLRAETLEREARANRLREDKERQAAQHAHEIWAVGLPPTGHRYAARKGLMNVGLRMVTGDILLQYEEFYGESGKSAIRAHDRYLLVPMCTAAGELRGVQAISEDGKMKSFMRGGQKRGTMLVLGAATLNELLSAEPPPRALAFAEGVATAESFRQGSGLPVVVCFDAGGLEHVAHECAAQVPHQTTPVLAVDNDQFFPEQAVGFLAEQLGVNPHARTGSLIEVSSGRNGSRLVHLGDAIADGEWHQAPFGRYCITFAREEESTEVKDLRVEIVHTESQRRITNRFGNRGVEAGLNALNAFSQGSRTALPVLAIPEFQSLDGKPTDWNDLHQIEGLGVLRTTVRSMLPLLDHTHSSERSRQAVPSVSR